jgi:hypothetical protein
MTAKTAQQNFRPPLSLASNRQFTRAAKIFPLSKKFRNDLSSQIEVPCQFLLHIMKMKLRFFTAKRKEIIMQTSADALSRAGVSRKDCTSNPTPFPKKTPVAMAYIPFQQFGELYPPEKGYQRGTIFPDLDKPWGGMMK